MFINYNLEATIDKVRLDQVIADEAANSAADAAHLAENATELHKKCIVSRHRNVYSKLKLGIPLKGFATGDSVCQGVGSSSGNTAWYKLLGAALNTHFGSSDWTPTNFGVGGLTVFNILNHISYTITYQNNFNGIQKTFPYDNQGKDYWVFVTGRNDWTQMTLQEFEYLYRIAVRMAKRNGIDVICCTEPPKLDMTTGNIVDGIDTPYPDYAEAIRSIADTEGCSLVDMFNEFTYRKTLDGEDIRTYSADGVHLNDSGQVVMKDMIYNCLLTIPSDNGESSPINENQEYNFVAQQIFTPSAGTYTLETFSEASPFAKYWHVLDSKAIKITAGNSVDFVIPNANIKAMIVTLVRNLTNGTITVMSPFGLNVSAGQTVTGTANQEGNIFIKPTNIDYPAANFIRVTAVGGDVYLMGITLITPILVAKHTKIHGTEVGTFTDSTLNGINYRATSAIGDTITVDWFGTNIAVNACSGPEMGKASIQTDGGTEAITDLYTTGYGYYKMIGSPFPLPLGWHQTIIKNVDKNPSSSANKMLIGQIDIYSLLPKNIVAKTGTNIEVYLNNLYNHVRSAVPYTITNKVLTTATDGTIETAIV